MTRSEARESPGGQQVSFGARLHLAMAARGPLCVGIDPHPGLLAAWGLEATAAGLERFALTAVEALGPVVAAVKPQSAFFETYGSAGIIVLERVLAAARDAGALTVLDVKRGDIGSTMTAYAAAYLADGAPLAADAITVSPYLGFGSLQPALELAAESGRGIFVLARTSNPEGGQIQQAVSGSGVTVAQQMVDDAAACNAGSSPMGSVGVVVGATHGDTGLVLSGLNGPILAPGLGAQGGTPTDLRTVFGQAFRWVLPASSRDVLQAGPSPAALTAAVARTLDGIRAALA